MRTEESGHHTPGTPEKRDAITRGSIVDQVTKDAEHQGWVASSLRRPTIIANM